MRILVDSNIIIRLIHRASAQHQMAFDAIDNLRLAKNQLCLAPQNVYETWVVATRPLSVNGLGFTFAQAQSEIAAWRVLFDFLDETPAVYSAWEVLVSTHNIIGKNAHDAHLVLK